MNSYIEKRFGHRPGKGCSGPGNSTIRKRARTFLLFICCLLLVSGCGGLGEKDLRPTLDLSEINDQIVREGSMSGVLEAEQPVQEKKIERPEVERISFLEEEKNQALSAIPSGRKESPPGKSGEQGGILLNFNNADIYEVIKVIAEALELNYIIDPRVKGVVNIHSGQKIPYSKLFPVFKKILHINGLDITKEREYYYIQAAKKASPDRVYGPGKADKLEDSSSQVIQVLPLTHIPAPEAMKLLEPYLSDQGGIYSLASHNLLVISDYESKVADALRILSRLDTATLSSMEIQLVRVDDAPISKLQEEMDEILTALMVNDKQLQGVKILPLPRINSLLLVGNSRQLVNMARRWIDELDVMPTSDRDSIYVYNVRNSVASSLAELVRQLISEEQPASTGGSPRVQKISQADQGKNQPGGNRPDAAAGVTGGEGGPPLTSLGFKGAPVIFADDDRNIILIRGLAPDYKRIVKILERLDTLPRQVLVEVVLAELTLNDDLSLGVEWAFHNMNISKDGQDYRQDFISNFTDLAFGGGAAPGFTYALRKDENVYGLLQTLASQNDVRVLSSPQLLVLNNETASINVGRQVPIVTTVSQNEAADSISSVDKTVQYRDTGVILEVTPQINYNGIILLDIKQNVSDALENRTSGIDSPVISQRELKTILAVKDGQSILMGGLIDQTDSQIASGIPLLMDIPGLGFLFKFERNQKEKTELLIMITPYVIESEDVLDQYIGEFEKKMKKLRSKLMREEDKPEQQDG